MRAALCRDSQARGRSATPALPVVSPALAPASRSRRVQRVGEAPRGRARAAAASAGSARAPSRSGRPPRTRAQHAAVRSRTARHSAPRRRQHRAPRRTPQPAAQRVGLAHRAQVAHQRQRVGIAHVEAAWLSATGSANPARCRRPPRSRISPIGATRGRSPPVAATSASASARAARAGSRPPNSAPSNSPSGRSARRHCTSWPDRIVRPSAGQRSWITRSCAPGAGRASSASASARRARRRRGRRSAQSAGARRRRRRARKASC